MFTVPNAVKHQYDAVLKFQEIAASQHANYKKWLRYYLDFCTNHPESNDKFEQVRLFLEKLQEKRQTEEQRRQAAHAITLFYDMHERIGNEYSPNAHESGEGGIVRGKENFEKTQSQKDSPIPASNCRVDELIREPPEQWLSPRVPSGLQLQQARVNRGSSHYCEAGYQEKSDSPEWRSLKGTLLVIFLLRP